MSLSGPERKLIKRHNDVESVIGHMKVDQRMDRWHLMGEIGGRWHAVQCSTGYTLRLLAPGNCPKGLGAFFAPCRQNSCGQSRDIRPKCSYESTPQEFVKWHQINQPGFLKDDELPEVP
jgi:hypothetical protein